MPFEYILSTLYCNFHKEVRLGGWGTEGLKAPTLGRHISACATMLRLRALLYLACVCYYVACVTLGLALVYCNFNKEVRLGSPNPYVRALLYLGCVRSYIRLCALQC